MVFRCSALIIFVSLVASITLYAAGYENKSRLSSLKIEDESLGELTAPDVAKDLRTIGYDDSERDTASGKRGQKEDSANFQKNNLEFARKIATLERSLSIMEKRYRVALRNQQPQRHVASDRDELESKVAPGLVYVLDSNSDLSVAVLGAGTLEGMRLGLVYRVVRERKIVARMRIVVVREHVSGGKVLEEGLKKFPEIGDQAVLGQPKN